MQMGARWQHGSVPHRSVPSALQAAIAEQELRFSDADSWTLTWLEGRPRVALDDRVELLIDPLGAVVVRELSNADDTDPAAGPHVGVDAASAVDDDDDWLN